MSGTSTLPTAPQSTYIPSSRARVIMARKLRLALSSLMRPPRADHAGGAGRRDRREPHPRNERPPHRYPGGVRGCRLVHVAAALTLASQHALCGETVHHSHHGRIGQWFGPARVERVEDLTNRYRPAL